LGALATTGFGFALETGTGAHAGGVQGSSSGKLSTEKHTPGWCIWGKGFFVRLRLTTFPQVSFTLIKAPQKISQ